MENIENNDDLILNINIVKNKKDGFANKFYFGLEKEGGSRNVEDYTKLKKTNIGDSFCVCGHKIKNKFHVKNLITNKVIIIGSCCIKKFNIQKLCDDCHKPHRNIKDNKCNDCRIRKVKIEEIKEVEEQIKEEIKNNNYTNFYNKVNEEIAKKSMDKKVNFGKYKDNTYSYIFENDKKYFIWMVNNVNIMDPNIKKYYSKKFIV